MQRFETFRSQDLSSARGRYWSPLSLRGSVVNLRSNNQNPKGLVLTLRAGLSTSALIFWQEGLHDIYCTKHLHFLWPKDINNFYLNLEAIKGLTKNIERSISYFKKRQNKSNGLSKVEDTFYQWLQTEARLCSKKIKSKRDKALRISRDSLPDEIHSKGNKRTKRGFRPLGTLISFLSDIPSPQSWERYESLVNKLREVVLGQQNQTHSIATAIVDITDTTRKLSENYESLTKITWDLKGEMDKFKFYLQASHKLVVTCRAQLSGNMGCTNELFKVYGYVPGQKDTKVH